MRLDPLRMAVAALALGPNIALAPFLSPHRTALDALPPNRCAHPDYDQPLFVIWLCKKHHRHDNPRFIAATTRLRRSTDKDLAMYASPLRRPEA